MNADQDQKNNQAHLLTPSRYIGRQEGERTRIHVIEARKYSPAHNSLLWPVGKPGLRSGLRGPRKDQQGPMRRGQSSAPSEGNRDLRTNMGHSTPIWSRNDASRIIM